MKYVVGVIVLCTIIFLNVFMIRDIQETNNEIIFKRNADMFYQEHKDVADNKLISNTLF